MVIMALDHTSGEFNAGRIFSDGAFLYKAGTALPTAQFLTRFVTHTCAPSFVTLAGTSLALSLAALPRERREYRSPPAHPRPRHRRVRALGLPVLDAVGALPLPGALRDRDELPADRIPLRRLPSTVLLAIAAGIVVFGEAIVRACGWGASGPAPLPVALLLVPGPQGRVMIAYPTLYWLALMLFGFVFGRLLSARPDRRRVQRGLVAAGAVLLALFAVVRGANGYGNMALLRGDDSLVQWLHVSKYPPSLSFVLLELGILSLSLAALQVLESRVTPSADGVLLVLGQTPMFFYLLHIPVLVLSAHALGVEHALGLGATYAIAVVVVAVLYPTCRAYRRYKTAHPDGWTRYL